MWRTCWIGVFVFAVAMIAEARAGTTNLAEGCGNNPQRPYVCDIGAPRPLSAEELEEVLDKNEALLATVRRIGKPDRAEIQRIRVREPWSQWEVRTYYKELDRMFVYGRAYILGSPVITILRHESRIPAPRRVALQPVAPKDGPAQAAAERAAEAAERSAAAAEKTAQLAQALADDAAEQFPRRLMKK